MEAERKQVMDFSDPVKDVSKMNGDYPDRVMTTSAGRVFWDADKYDRENKNPKKNSSYDWSRRKLNFRIDLKTGKAAEIDPNEPNNVVEKWKESIDKRYTAMQTYFNPKTGVTYQKKRPIRSSESKFFEISFGGNRERMHELAFDCPVDTKHHGTNGEVQRKKEIEQWAEDCFQWAAGTFGQENILNFTVHLDETNPHIHCYIFPIVDGALNYSKMMHGEYRKGEKRGSNKERSSEYMKGLHTDFYEKVGSKWGLMRGDPINVTGAKHRDNYEYKKELNKTMQEVEQEKQRKEELEASNAALQEDNKKLESAPMSH